jgi:DNA (cytosine-5)-methyltransferase 1
VGIKNNDETEFEFPTERPDLNNLQDIVNFSMEGALKITSTDFDMTQLPDECIVKDMENEDVEQVEGLLKPHPNLKALARVRDYTYQGKAYPLRLHFGKRIPVGGEVIDIRKSINTIICTYARQPRFFVPQQNKNGYYLRALLPDELKQIQGFPSDYEICGNKSQKIVQIGNAVPPPLIYEIVKKIIETNN